jgi:diaminohydroxyphosphoribosylaminopyrimidine deaminase/5-amino-6-(5-phosphoribosylamino)uracil reductase
MNTDEEFMLECLTLAEKGAGYASPNPMVGSVIVRDGKIIGRGYHKKFGEPHAEINAIRNSTRPVKGATMYVNLEPCSHHGKTPPCADALIAAGISRVVIGMKDPNPAVSGKGISRLRRAGVRVDTGVLEPECRKLNRAFSKYITTRVPYVSLKIAQTADGKIADGKGKSQWITSVASRQMVHRLRSQYDGVLVGAGTIENDNPHLTVHDVKGRNPARIVLTPSLDLSFDAHVLSNAQKERVILFADPSCVRKQEKKIKMLSARGVKVFFLPRHSNGMFSLPEVLRILGEQDLTSVLVEGGAATFSEFLKQKTADEAFIFVAPKILGRGLDAFAGLQSLNIGSEVSFSSTEFHRVGPDLMIEASLNF